VITSHIIWFFIAIHFSKNQIFSKVKGLMKGIEALKIEKAFC